MEEEEKWKERIKRLEESVRSSIRGLKIQLEQKDKKIKELKEKLRACRRK